MSIYHRTTVVLVLWCILACNATGNKPPIGTPTQVNHEAPSQVDTQEDMKLNDTQNVLPSPPLGSATALDPDVEVIDSADMGDQPVLARQINRRPGDPRIRLMGPRLLTPANSPPPGWTRPQQGFLPGRTRNPPASFLPGRTRDPSATSLPGQTLEPRGNFLPGQTRDLGMLTTFLPGKTLNQGTTYAGHAKAPNGFKYMGTVYESAWMPVNQVKNHMTNQGFAGFNIPQHFQQTPKQNWPIINVGGAVSSSQGPEQMPTLGHTQVPQYPQQRPTLQGGNPFMLPGQTQMQPFNTPGGFLPGRTLSNGVQDIVTTCERKSCYVNCRLNGLGGGRCTRGGCVCYAAFFDVNGAPTAPQAYPEDQIWYALTNEEQESIRHAKWSRGDHDHTRPDYRPTARPTFRPFFPTTSRPTARPTYAPTARPTFVPTPRPAVPSTARPTFAPVTTSRPTFAPTTRPTYAPTPRPTYAPTPRPDFSPSTTTADPYDAPEDDWFGGGGDDYNYEENDEDYYEADEDDGFGDDGFGDDGFGDSGDGAGDGFDDFEEDSDDEWDW